jgi:hypothetical protein
LRNRIAALQQAEPTRRVVLEGIRGTAQINPRAVQVRVLHSGLRPYAPGATDQAQMEAEAAAWSTAYFSVVLVPADGSGRSVQAFVLPPRPDDIKRDAGQSSTTIRFTFSPPEASIGSWGWLGQSWTVEVLPCVRFAGAEPFAAGYGVSEPVYLFNADLGWLLGLLAAVLFIVLGGIGIAYINAWQYQPKVGGQPPSLGWFARFNPIVICQDSLGYSSFARFQIFLFSTVLLGLFAYAFVMTGQPPGISTSVLTLLGITVAGSAAGTIAAKPTVTDAEHRLWLVGTGVLKREQRTPRFADLFTSDGAVDITRLQALGFTILAAIALVYNGHADLASYELPSQLNTLIGISQATYVAGKAVKPEGLTRLNDEVKALVDAEQKVLREGPGTDDVNLKDFNRKRDGIKVALMDVYGTSIDTMVLANLAPGR